MTYKSCTSKDTVKVNVFPLNGLTAGADTIVGEGFSLQLNASYTGDEGFAKYKWIPSVFLDNDSIRSPLFTATTALIDLVQYSVMATTKDGCIETASLNITIAGNILPYSGFTPNGDDKNEHWQIDNAEAYPNIKVSVFNRWGDKVFYSKGYDNVTKVFNGTRNGKNLPDGTYYYIIEINGSKRSSGPLTIVR